jgi:hypothetical protein
MTRMKTFKLSILLSAALLVLASCGGNSDSPTIPAPEGAFTGSFSNGIQLTNLVIADGTFWSVYGSSVDDIHGFGRGDFKADGKGKFTLALSNYAEPGNDPKVASGSGTYTSSSIAGSVSEEGQTLSFKVSAMPDKNYVFKTPASLTSVAGKWSGKLLDGENGDIDIGPDGVFTGSSSGGCHFTGKFDTTKVNVFNVSVTSGGAPCVFPGETSTGIGVTFLRDDGKHQLLVAVINSAQTAGSLFSAAR